ncbi:kinase-like domain-containing protein [Chytridium lagenaria]|nr:kinase-like domain-containing protein [Chytridium lagenaria]
MPLPTVTFNDLVSFFMQSIGRGVGSILFSGGVEWTLGGCEGGIGVGEVEAEALEKIKGGRDLWGMGFESCDGGGGTVERKEEESLGLKLMVLGRWNGDFDVTPAGKDDDADVSLKADHGEQIMARIPSDAVSVSSQSIGSGATGIVFKAKYANETVVVKRLKVQSLSGAARENFEKEALTLSKLNHPRIVRFLGVVVDKNVLSIVLEYLPLGSMFSFYTSEAKLPYSNRLSLAIDITSGMEFLHNQNPPILHRDLKSLNILMSINGAEELHAKITDFGLATVQSSTYRKPCDVYSFGVVLSELFSWVGPFGIPIPELRFDVLHHMLVVKKEIPDVELDADVPSTIADLIASCLSLHPAARPSFSDVAARLAV